jgi:hypothetical protein
MSLFGVLSRRRSGQIKEEYLLQHGRRHGEEAAGMPKITVSTVTVTVKHYQLLATESFA